LEAHEISDPHRELHSGTNVEVCNMSWVLWSSSASDEVAAIHQEVDRIFSGFSFYPEVEWRHYRFGPPEGHKVLGAWRHPDGVAFVFLMNNPGMESPSGTAPLILSYDGRRADLVPLLPRVRRLKKELARKNGRRASDRRLSVRLEKAATSKSLRRLMALMAPITAVINGLALYLHKLPPPTIESAWLSSTYKCLLPLVYISALGLLFIFTVVCMLYICKYGILLLRRL